MTKALSSIGSGVADIGAGDPATGAFQTGIGARRPGFTDLTIDLKNVGGITSKISGKNNLKIKTSGQRKSLIQQITDILNRGATELEDIRGLVRPGFSEFRRAGLESIGTRARQSIGNLRENLARRRVLGSSFAEDAILRAEREFAQEESEFAAATTLQELDVFTQLTQQITQQQVAAVERQVQELNLQLDVGLALAGKAADSLTAASIQQQRNAAAFSQQVISTGAAAAAGCAIAREVYGINNPRWFNFRRWLFREAPVWVFRWYLKNQYRVAEKLRNKPLMKCAVRFIMDRIIDG